MSSNYVFKSVHFSAPDKGKRLLITGAVHGNETCGTKGILRVLQDIEEGRLTICKGSVTFVPITNPMAYALNRRSGDRNLNRNLTPTNTPLEFEDHIANWLCPLMAQHDVLLDLHSFSSPTGKAFVMVGPENNDGALEPFRFATQEADLALRLGVTRFVDGWLSTYARGMEARRQRLGERMTRQEQLDSDPRYGVGTTEYMRSVGGMALTLECGSHEDPHAPDVAYQAIVNTLAHFGHIDAAAPAVAQNIEALRISDVIDKTHNDDTFSREWASFDPLHVGDLIGTRHDGTPVIAQDDGYILFPSYNGPVGQEWFYLTKHNPRLDKA
jgi:predicted deacylase